MSHRSAHDRRTKDRPTKRWSSAGRPIDANPTVAEQNPIAAERPAAALSIAIVTAEGVKKIEATSTDVRDLIAAERFFWIDIAGGDEAARAPVLGQLGIEAADLAWMQRFRQTGRMALNPQRLRAVTWLTEGLDHGLVEIHVLCIEKMIVTVWNGDARSLDEIRKRLAERMAELDKSPAAAVAILMQLLLGTVHDAISEIDGRLQTLQLRLAAAPASVDYSSLEDQIRRLQSAWSDIDRYSSAVNTATIGVEALPGIDQRGADELNEYADQVEDLEHRLHVRSRWGQDLLHDCATAIARRQSEQISRLTLVSMIFLPLTFLTGFFGMNFQWMVGVLKGPAAFVVLGVLAPALCVIATVFLLRRRGF